MSDGVSKFVLAMGAAPGSGVNPYVQLIPIALVLSVGILAAIHYTLSRTVAGRWLYAVGHNAQAARISGVPSVSPAI